MEAGIRHARGMGAGGVLPESLILKRADCLRNRLWCRLILSPHVLMVLKQKNRNILIEKTCTGTVEDERISA